MRGLSIMELMIGVTVGMIVVSGALMLFVRNLNGSRLLLNETRLNQDLRAAVDLVTRDLRRAGYWGNAIQGTIALGATSATTQNPYSAVSTVSTSEVTYEFSRDAAEDNSLAVNEQFGFRLSGGAIQMNSGNGWTDITDTRSITITNFQITPTVTSLPLGHLCPKTCAVGAPNCPTVTVRSFNVLVQGQSVGDSNVLRDLRSTVRVRNDQLAGNCPVA
jgi:type IV pilus assembly protein PilW